MHTYHISHSLWVGHAFPPIFRTQAKSAREAVRQILEKEGYHLRSWKGRKVDGRTIWNGSTAEATSVVCFRTLIQD